MTAINILLFLKVFLSHKHNLLKKIILSACFLLILDFLQKEKERTGWGWGCGRNRHGLVIWWPSEGCMVVHFINFLSIIWNQLKVEKISHGYIYDIVITLYLKILFYSFFCFSVTTVKFEVTYYNYDHYEEDKNWAL